VLIVVCQIYLGLKNPIAEEQVEVRRLELQEMVKMFQHDAETHAQVRKNVPRSNLPPTAGDAFRDANYLVIQYRHFLFSLRVYINNMLVSKNRNMSKLIHEFRKQYTL
jgi:hypothetical protein